MRQEARLQVGIGQSSNPKVEGVERSVARATDRTEEFPLQFMLKSASLFFPRYPNKNLMIC
jgi:hypothetical protein